MSRPAEALPQLLASDFDGTIALTHEPAPNGMTVPLAYEVAVVRVFGHSALQQYQAEGGLNNRAPLEIVRQLAPGMDTSTLYQRAEDLVEVKLAHLMSEVGNRSADGERWPRPTSGFVSFWRGISPRSDIDTAVVSSGHQAFIEKFFDVQGLGQPDILVTDDDMRPLMTTYEPEQLVKPSAFLLQMAHARSAARRRRLGLVPPVVPRDRVAYVGDDLVKDGRLADNAAVEFVHFRQEKPDASWLQALDLLLSRSVKVDYV